MSSPSLVLAFDDAHLGVAVLGGRFHWRWVIARAETARKPFRIVKVWHGSPQLQGGPMDCAVYLPKPVIDELVRRGWADPPAP